MKSRSSHTQRGAALLMALIILTLISSLAVSMVWQQWRAVQVESAERGRAQSAWILTGALDWTRLILREDLIEDNRKPAERTDHLGEPWAVPLAEARLSTFLAVDNSNADDAPETFLSGAIVDAQARYNLKNLLNPKGQVVAAELEILQRLCVHLGLAGNVANQMADGLKKAASSTTAESQSTATDIPLMPSRLEQLSWLGIDPRSIKKLEPHIVLLPSNTPVNANTSSREVMAAVLNVDLGSAQRLVQMRDRTPFKATADITPQLPQGGLLPPPNQLSVYTQYFFITGKVRLSNQILEQRSLVKREGRNKVTPLSREWVNSNDATETPN
jgi:general secretion pathway protein K